MSWFFNSINRGMWRILQRARFISMMKFVTRLAIEFIDEGAKLFRKYRKIEHFINKMIRQFYYSPPLKILPV